MWSAGQQAKEDAILQRREHFEAEVEQLREGLGKPKCAKRCEDALERAKRLKKRRCRVARRYAIAVSHGERRSGKRKGKAVAVTTRCNGIRLEDQ